MNSCIDGWNLPQHCFFKSKKTTEKIIRLPSQSPEDMQKLANVGNKLSKHRSLTFLGHFKPLELFGGNTYIKHPHLPKKKKILTSLRHTASKSVAMTASAGMFKSPGSGGVGAVVGFLSTWSWEPPPKQKPKKTHSFRCLEPFWE